MKYLSQWASDKYEQNRLLKRALIDDFKANAYCLTCGKSGKDVRMFFHLLDNYPYASGPDRIARKRMRIEALYIAMEHCEVYCGSCLYTVDGRAEKKIQYYKDHPKIKTKKPPKEKTIREYTPEQIGKLQWYKTFKRELSCEGCGLRPTGSKDCKNFHFHHVDPTTKVFEVSKGTWSQEGCHTMEEMIDEMCKCQFLCRACHEKIHGNAPKTQEM